MNIELKEIKFGSAEYKLEIDLRTKVLREPLGLQFSEQDLAEEQNDIRIGAFQNERLVGCLLLRPVGNSILKMRQVAVDAEFQGLGIGKKLVEASEIKAKDMGIDEIQLHARDTAVPFYLKLGYNIFDEAFHEVGIPHRKMKKRMTTY